MWHKKPPEWFATETKTIFQISVSQLLLSVNLMSRLRTSTSVWRLCLVSKVEKEANFNNCNQILVICFQHLCDTYSNLSINMVFDKMGLYFASGKLKWTTENYVTLVVGAGADLGGCAWGVHPHPPPRDDLRLSTTTGILRENMWFRPVTCQLRHSLVVHPLLRNILHPPLMWQWLAGTDQMSRNQVLCRSKKKQKQT